MPNNSISYLLPILKMKRRAWMVKSENTTNANQHKYNQLAWFSFRRDELCQYYYILSQSRWLSYIQSIKLLKIQMRIWYHEYAFIFVRIFQFIIKALNKVIINQEKKSDLKLNLKINCILCITFFISSVIEHESSFEKTQFTSDTIT